MFSFRPFSPEKLVSVRISAATNVRFQEVRKFFPADPSFRFAATKMPQRLVFLIWLQLLLSWAGGEAQLGSRKGRTFELSREKQTFLLDGEPFR